ncbi:hypothetical protein E9993_09870 [Labilibacter sediminis]|nr:hypothetical protein E9993_09870 [Labilibacter sediminis]
MKYISILLFALLILSGCASKRYVKKALKYENTGLYTDAAEQYYNSLVANAKNIDAKLGLQRTGQLVLDDKIDHFKAQYQNGTPKEAVYAYRSAESYFMKLKAVGVNLILSEEQKTYYKEVEDIYLNKLYQDASKALSLEEFVSSEKLFSEILSINKSYKDAQSKWVTAKYEPEYRKGNSLMQSQMYRSAYGVFNQIIAQVGTYKDCHELRSGALKLAKVTISISPFKASYSAYKPQAEQIELKVANGINAIKSPFYEVVTNKSFESDPFKKAYEYDRTKGFTNRVSSKATLTGVVQKYAKYNGRLGKTEKHAYLKRTEEYVDEETKVKKTRTVYDKVKYYEYRLERKVMLSMKFSMNRTDKNELVISDVFNEEEVDKLYYAEFEGDYKQLVPGTWKYMSKESDGDRVYDNSAAIENLRKMFKARKTAKSLTELENILLDSCTKSIVVQIENYKPEN